MLPLGALVIPARSGRSAHGCAGGSRRRCAATRREGPDRRHRAGGARWRAVGSLAGCHDCISCQCDGQCGGCAELPVRRARTTASPLLNLPAAWPNQHRPRGDRGGRRQRRGRDESPSSPRGWSPAMTSPTAPGSTKDGEGHGTHVAGIVAQVAPVRPNHAGQSARLGRPRQQPRPSPRGFARAADHGAGVINLSIDQSGVLGAD